MPMVKVVKSIGLSGSVREKEDGVCGSCYIRLELNQTSEIIKILKWCTHQELNLKPADP